MFLNIDKKTNEIFYVIDNIKELVETEDRKFIETNIKELDFLMNKNFYNEETKEIKSIKMLENSVKQVFNYKNMKWEEKATLEEQLAHWRNELIKADRKCREEQELFGVASQESLVLKQKYMDLHMQVSHELAIKQEVVINGR